MSRLQALKWPNYLYYGKEGRLVDEDGAEKDEDLQRMFKVLANTMHYTCILHQKSSTLGLALDENAAQSLRTNHI